MNPDELLRKVKESAGTRYDRSPSPQRQEPPRLKRETKTRSQTGSSESSDKAGSKSLLASNQLKTKYVEYAEKARQEAERLEKLMIAQKEIDKKKREKAEQEAALQKEREEIEKLKQFQREQERAHLIAEREAEEMKELKKYEEADMRKKYLEKMQNGGKKQETGNGLETLKKSDAKVLNAIAVYFYQAGDLDFSYYI